MRVIGDCRTIAGHSDICCAGSHDQARYNLATTRCEGVNKTHRYPKEILKVE